jgi:hypothetical protein
MPASRTRSARAEPSGVPFIEAAVVAEVITETTKVLRTFARSAVQAVVPLVVGVAGGIVATLFFVFLLSGQTLTAFFSAASSVDIGLLIALIVNTATATTTAAAREGRAGTVALVNIGMIAALIGQLTIGSTPLKGVLFAVTWGGITAGVLGLVFFVRLGQSGSIRDTAERREIWRRARDESDIRSELRADRVEAWQEAVEEPDPAAQFSITELRAEAKQPPVEPPPERRNERSS